MSAFKRGRNGDEDVLTCANCGEGLTHHDEPEVDPKGIVTITYDCEGCWTISELRIVQDRGETVFETRDTGYIRVSHANTNIPRAEGRELGLVR